MLRPVRGPLGYVVAIVAVAVAIVLKVLMSAVGSTHPFVVLAAGVIVAAWLGGRGPGLLAVALAAIGSGFLFLAPGGFGADDLLAVAALIAENILIVEITVRLRAAQERAGAEAAEAQKARTEASFALQMREELLTFWSQRLRGPFGDLSSRLARRMRVVFEGREAPGCRGVAADRPHGRTRETVRERGGTRARLREPVLDVIEGPPVMAIEQIEA